MTRQTREHEDAEEEEEDEVVPCATGCVCNDVVRCEVCAEYLWVCVCVCVVFFMTPAVPQADCSSVSSLALCAACGDFVGFSY